MRTLFAYLRPHRGLAALALLLAGISQVLALVDPIIFGQIIDGYTIQPDDVPEQARVDGVLQLLALAVAIAVISRLARAVQEYVTRSRSSAPTSSTTGSSTSSG